MKTFLMLVILLALTGFAFGQEKPKAAVDSSYAYIPTAKLLQSLLQQQQQLSRQLDYVQGQIDLVKQLPPQDSIRVKK